LSHNLYHFKGLDSKMTGPRQPDLMGGKTRNILLILEILSHKAAILTPDR